MLDVALVGTGGMMPLPHRWLASVLVRWGARLVLFDCGEGTQISLQALGWGIKGIDLILVSHLHGDHVTGLPGLLLSQGNAGRTEAVRVVGPPGLSQAVAALRVVAPYLPFPVDTRDLVGGETLSLGELRVSTCPADHGIPCLAYRLDLPRRPRFDVERARALGLPLELWKVLQGGEAVRWQGRQVAPDEVLGPPRPGLAVGLVTDSRPAEALVPFFEGVDLLVCEATYASPDDQPRAVERKHMTFAEAAALAARARARRLVLTHFSPSVDDPQAFAPLAQAIFPETVVGRDHLVLSLRYPPA